MNLLFSTQQTTSCHKLTIMSSSTLARNNNSIEEAKQQLNKWFTSLNIDTQNISDYSKKYLTRYKTEHVLYTNHYANLLKHAVSQSNKSITELTVLDYGGGIGIMSHLLSLAGAKAIVYNDIFETSTNDTKTLAKTNEIRINHFITGDITETINYLEINKLNVDLIISMDVLEHIYSLSSWFSELAKIKHPYILFFNTGANPKNPLIKHRITKIQKIVEFKGQKVHEGWKERDSKGAFIKIREGIINDLSIDFTEQEVKTLTSDTRGLIKSDIEAYALSYAQTKKRANTHPYYLSNTCDPLTGNWEEHLINLPLFIKDLKKLGLNASIVNGKYPYSQNKFKNFLKRVLNIFMRCFPLFALNISPSYSLIIKPKT